MQGQELLPFVENYNKSNYQGDNQIWNVAQGNDAAMYFANNHYLLRYDGVIWEKYTLPNKTIIRSILIDGDKIYSGSYKEFGYWHRKEGKMQYTSITKNLRLFAEKDNEEIWKIFKFKGAIYFQSFNGVFIYDGKSIKKIKLPFLISYCFVVDETLYVASVQKGVYNMKSNKISSVKGWEILRNTVVHAILKHQNKTYVFTQKKGVFVVDGGKLLPWSNAFNTILKSTTINSAIFVKNKLIIGTGNKGLYVLNLNTNAYKNIDRNNVLMNNSILSIGLDKENDLWLGLDNGIAHVEINSPVAIFYDNTGLLGSVYSIAATDKGYLIASNHGVFEYGNSGKFDMIPNTRGQAWNITKIGTKYIIGHNDGSFVYDANSFSKISGISGGWNLSKSGINNTYFQSTYSGVLIYDDINNLTHNQVVKDLSKPIKYVAQNKKNEIFAADNYRGLYRVLYDDKYNTRKVENISQQSNLKNDFGVKIFEFRNEILFLIDNNWYTYNSITNKLEENELFTSNFKNISNVVAIDENHFVVVQEGILYHIYANGNKFIWNIIPEKYYKGKLINDNLKIFKTKNSYLLNLDDGFISLGLKDENKEKLNLKIEAFNNQVLVPNDAKIKYNSELKLNLISGLYGANKPNLFYTLNSNKAKYYPVSNGLIVLNNLNSGYHSVEVYKHDGANYYELTNFDFYVAQPWYFSFWMIMLYLIFIGFVLFLYYKWNKLRYLQKLKLQAEELKHHNQILEMELKAENELNVQEYEKHILELELQTKSSEVAGKSLSIAKQSEMIDKIQGILDSENDFNKLKSEIKKAIKINEVNKHEWETFETNLNQIHNEFIINLTKKYPNLTQKDIKLCVYLKMNLSSKEIAPMMNISFRGVELHRYRLRKKLSLEQDDNLSKFLLNL